MQHTDDPTIVYGGIDYTEITLASCAELAERLQAAGTPWHSHALIPGCAYNPYARYAVVIEDDKNKRAFVAASEQFPEVDKTLVRMLHGDDILAEQRTAASTGKHVGSQVLDRLLDIERRRARWHHHMCFPDCSFNQDPGTWLILVESEEGSFSESWPEEPVDVLREIEVKFFQRAAER